MQNTAQTELPSPQLHPSPAIPHRNPPGPLTLDIQEHRHLHRLIPSQPAGEGDPVVGLVDRGYADVADVHFIAFIEPHLPIPAVPEQLLGLAAVVYEARERDGRDKLCRQGEVSSVVIYRQLHTCRRRRKRAFKHPKPCSFPQKLPYSLLQASTLEEG